VGSQNVWAVGSANQAAPPVHRDRNDQIRAQRSNLIAPPLPVQAAHGLANRLRSRTLQMQNDVPKLVAIRAQSHHGFKLEGLASTVGTATPCRISLRNGAATARATAPSLRDQGSLARATEHRAGGKPLQVRVAVDTSRGIQHRRTSAARPAAPLLETSGSGRHAVSCTKKSDHLETVDCRRREDAKDTSSIITGSWGQRQRGARRLSP